MNKEIQRLKKTLEIVVPLKYLSNFWRSLNMPLINCEVSLALTWSKNCVLTDVTTQAARNANPNTDPPAEARERINAPTNPTFDIKDTEFYVPLVTLSTKDVLIFYNNQNQDLKELLNGINTDQKSLIRLKLTT